MVETEQILIEMAAGFSKIHDRLNAMMGETAARQLRCAERFSLIERDIGIHSAVNGEKEKIKIRKVDFQSFLVRGALASIIIGIGVIIWKIFVGHIDLIVK